MALAEVKRTGPLFAVAAVYVDHLHVRRLACCRPGSPDHVAVPTVWQLDQKPFFFEVVKIPDVVDQVGRRIQRLVAF